MWPWKSQFTRFPASIPREHSMGLTIGSLSKTTKHMTRRFVGILISKLFQKERFN